MTISSNNKIALSKLYLSVYYFISDVIKNVLSLFILINYSKNGILTSTI